MTGDVETKFMQDLAEIKAYQKVILDRLNNISLGSDRLGITPSANEHLLPALPVNTLEKLTELETLINKEEPYKQLEFKLSYVGGHNRRNCIKRCLSHIWTNELAESCSWTGQKKNFKVRDLTIIKCIKVAVKVNFPDITDRDFEEIIMNWFRHGKQRKQREKAEKNDN